jgi:hypothetical protein
MVYHVGIVGVINSVSKNYATILIYTLNTNSSINAKHKRKLSTLVFVGYKETQTLYNWFNPKELAQLKLENTRWRMRLFQGVLARNWSAIEEVLFDENA